MDFRLSEQQRAVQKMARDFVAQEIIPHASEWEKNFEIPRSVIDKMAKHGMLGGPIPKQYGGAGMDFVSYYLMEEEIARGSASLKTTVAVQTSLAESTFLNYGTEEQKMKYLVPLAKGQKIGAFALTEPNVGSDAMSIETTAKLKGNEWVINGTKRFISNGDIADVVILMATNDRKKRDLGICAFILEKGTPGFGYGKVLTKEKLGLRCSHTAELVLDDCRIPRENIIAGEGRGWEIAMRAMDHGRLSVAAGAVGIARGCLEESMKYSKQRSAFGKPISSFQLIKEMIADMATEIDAGRLMYLRAAHMADLGQGNTLQVSMAKLYNAQMVMRVADKAIQIHGGYGFSGDFPVERYYRDARICGIYEGTNEIQKLIISRELTEKTNE